MRGYVLVLLIKPFLLSSCKITMFSTTTDGCLCFLHLHQDYLSGQYSRANFILDWIAKDGPVVLEYRSAGIVDGPVVG